MSHIPWNLPGMDYEIIRFPNNDVMGNLDGVVQVVLHALEAAPTSP
jgi:very-short-patch-repair endonuclease